MVIRGGERVTTTVMIIARSRFCSNDKKNRDENETEKITIVFTADKEPEKKKMW